MQLQKQIASKKKKRIFFLNTHKYVHNLKPTIVSAKQIPLYKMLSMLYLVYLF